MVLLYSFCCPFKCCRPKVRKDEHEEPYGVISRDDPNSANEKNATHVSFRLPNGGGAPTRERFSHPIPSTSFTSQRDQKLSQRSSMPSSNPNKSVKRALPKLPGLDGDESIETYTSIERRHTSPLSRTSPKPNHSNSSHPFIEDGINPTYESIDAESDSISDPLYSKVDNGNIRKYDYPIFNGVRSHAGTTNLPEALYQSASQIYTVGSEDPYSSITSQGGADTNYLGYVQVKDSIANPIASKTIDNSDSKPSTSKRVDDLYTKIQRPSPPTILPTKEHNPRESGDQFISLPSTSYQQSESNQGYVSSGSEKASREPSYRYITVRESVDVIRRRLNEREIFSGTHTPPTSISRNMSNTSESIDGILPIREHYYSSIGGGSDYESVSIAALYEHIPDLSTGNIVNEQTTNSSKEVNNSFDVLSKNEDGMQASTSSVRLRSVPQNRDDPSNKVSDNSSSSVPPKPPTSPIPNRISSDAIDLKCFRYSDDPKVIPFIENSPPYASIHYDNHNPHNSINKKSNKSSISDNSSMNSTTNVLQSRSHLFSSPPNNNSDIDKSNSDASNKTVSKSDQNFNSSFVNTEFSPNKPSSETVTSNITGPVSQHHSVTTAASIKLSSDNISGNVGGDEDKTNRGKSHSVEQYDNPQIATANLSDYSPHSDHTTIPAADTDHDVNLSRVIQVRENDPAFENKMTVTTQTVGVKLNESEQYEPFSKSRFISSTICSQRSAVQRNSLPEYCHSQVSPQHTTKHFTNSCISVLPSAPYRTASRSRTNVQSYGFNSGLDSVGSSKSMSALEQTLPVELKTSNVEAVLVDRLGNISQNTSPQESQCASQMYRSEVEAYVVKPSDSLSYSTPLSPPKGIYSEILADSYTTERNAVVDRSVNSTGGKNGWIGQSSMKSIVSVGYGAEHDNVNSGDKAEEKSFVRKEWRNLRRSRESVEQGADVETENNIDSEVTSKTLPQPSNHITSSTSSHSHPTAKRISSKTFTNSLMQPPTPESIFQPLSPGNVK